MKHLKLFSWLFRRKKKKKEKEKTIFGEPLPKEKKESRESFRQRFPIFSNRKKLNIPSFMKFKRILAGLLFIIYALVSLMSLSETYSLLFIGTAFILFEYMRETRKSQWVKQVEET